MLRDRFTACAWIVLGASLLVILWGAAVRATGSGGSCGGYWPTCNGEIIAHPLSTEILIELGHRLSAAVVLLMVVALLVAARRAFPAPHRVRRGALWAMIFMLGEIVIGAAMALFEVAADGESMARPLFTAVHLGNALLLLAALAATAWWAGGGAAPDFRGQGRRRLLAGSVLAATWLMATTGTVAALGDSILPAATMGDAIRRELSLSAHVLIQLRTSHPLVAVMVSLLLLYYIGTVRQHAMYRPAKRFANLLNLAIFAQLIAGAINIMLLAPIWMQLPHLLLAAVVWILLVLTCAASLARPPSLDAGGDS